MRPVWNGPPIVSLDDPSADPLLSLAVAKQHLRVEHDDDDDTIETLIATAAALLDGWEGALRRALLVQDWRIAVREADGCGRLWAPLSPVLTLESVQYYAPDAETLTTATLSDFRLIKAPDWAYIEPKPGFAWPSVDDRPDALQAVFSAGYGDDVPPTILHAAKLLIGHLYENREETTSLKLSRLPFGVEALISPHKLGFAA